MGIVLDFKLVLMLRVYPLLHVATATFYDQYYDPINNQDSQSQENTSDVDQKLEDRHSMRSYRNRNNNYNNNPISPIQQQIQMIPMPQMSVPMQMQMPMQLPQAPSQSIPQLPMQMQQMGMPQMQQMPIPPVQMPQMQMPSMPMPQMPLPMLPMSMQMQGGPLTAPFPGPYPGSNFMYFPISSQFSDFLKNITSSKSSPPNEQTTLAKANSIITTMTTQASTTSQVTATTRATTTTQAKTTISTTPRLTQPTVTSTEKQFNIYSQFPNVYLNTQRNQNNLLASVLKNAIESYSNNIAKAPQRHNNINNRYMFTTMRKTKPTWVPKFEIVPIPDNMAQRLMTQMRSMKGIRRRPKRLALLEIE